MADTIQILRTPTPDKAPTGGSLAPGTLAVEMASAAPRLWVGVDPALGYAGNLRLVVDSATIPSLPLSVANGGIPAGGTQYQVLGKVSATDRDVAWQQVTADNVGVAANVTSGLPTGNAQTTLQGLYTAPGQAANALDTGAFVRRKHGTTYSWETRVIYDASDWWWGDPSPVLSFINDDAKGVLFATESFGWQGGVGATFSANRNSAAAWIYAFETGYGLVIDNAGSFAGIFIDNDNRVSPTGPGRGIEIQRGPTAGPSIFLQHKGANGLNSPTPADYLIGDIAFAGMVDNVWVRPTGAIIQGVSSQLWTTAARGTRLEFWTTPNGQAAPRRSMVIDHDGGLQIMRSGVLTSLDSVLSGIVTSPGGTNRQLQFNNNNTSFGGANITVSADGNSLTIPGTVNDLTFHGEHDNISIGSYGTLGANTAGGNIGIGHGVLYSTVSGDDNIVLGHWAVYQGDLVYSNVVIGVSALVSLIAGDANTVMGHSGASNSINAERGTFIGANATAQNPLSSYNETALGSNTIGHGDNTITLGDLTIGGLYCQQTTITQLSDPRLKENIEPADLDRCLTAVEELPVHRYRWKEQAGAHHDKHVTGWLPDDVAKVFPKAVSACDIRRNGTVVEDCQHITMTEALPTLWGAVQRLSQKIEKLEKRSGRRK